MTDQSQPLGAKLASSPGWEICHINVHFTNKPTRPDRPEKVSTINDHSVFGPYRRFFAELDGN